MSSRAGLSRQAKKTTKYTEEVVSGSDGVSSEEDDKGNDSGGKKRRGKKATNEKVGEEDGSDAIEFTNSKRRGRKGQKAKKGEAGKKEEVKRGCPFNMLPLELVTEVLSRVHSKDILAFSRTNKYYRSVLMSKARSNRLWKHARERLGLPDLKVNGLSKPAYAALLWDQQCSFCPEHKRTSVEVRLRVRLCVACRKLHTLSLDNLRGKAASFHPATAACVVATSRSALIKDLHHYDQKLSALQRADEADDTLKLPARSDSDSSVHRQSRRGNLRRNGKGPVSYCETEDEDQPPVIRLGGRVEKFVAKRKRVVAKVCSDGWEIEKAYGEAVRVTEKEESRLRAASRRSRNDERQTFADSLEERLGLAKRYVLDESRSDDSEYDYARIHNECLPWSIVNSVFKEGEPLTDERWTVIRPKVVKAIARVKKREEAKMRQQAAARRRHEAAKRLSSRQESCRPHYASLKASLQHFMCFPTFAEFLLLPSVKPLWQRSMDEDNSEEDSDDASTVDEGSWKLLLPLIKIEIEEYHLDFVTSAVRLILSTQRDFDTDDELEEAVQGTLAGDLDLFFSLASSLVACGECRGKPARDQRSYGFYQNYPNGRYLGRVFEVVAHLHNKHASISILDNRKTEAMVPICLPIQVASTISALLEVGDLSAGQATMRDLDQLDLGRYEWENHVGRKSYAKWRDLVDAVSLAAYKAERRRSKEPIDLPTPIILYYPPPQNKQR